MYVKLNGTYRSLSNTIVASAVLEMVKMLAESYPTLVKLAFELLELELLLVELSTLMLLFTRSEKSNCLYLLESEVSYIFTRQENKPEDISLGSSSR